MLSLCINIIDESSICESKSSIRLFLNTSMKPNNIIFYINKILKNM